MTTKQCSKCQTEKETTEFYPYKKSFAPWCRSCFSVARRLRYQAHKEEEKLAAKQQRANSPEYFKIYNKAYAAKNRVQIRENARRRYKDNPGKTLVYEKTYRKNNVEKHLFWKAKSRAKRKGQDFNIEITDIVVQKCCPVFGLPYDFTGKNKWLCPSLDRIDNTKGYIKGNVHVVSHRANTLKSNASIEELEKLVSYLRSL